MEFNKLQAIEYALNSFDMLLHEQRRIEVPKRKLVFCYGSKLFTATTMMDEDQYNPMTISWNDDKVYYRRSSSRYSSEDSFFTIIRKTIKERYHHYPSNIDLLEADQLLLLHSIKEFVNELNLHDTNESPAVFRNVNFLESNVNLPFLDLGIKTNEVELVSLLVDTQND
ncbi:MULTISPECIES: hypothetical protein [Enterococcus]|uniref:hypothetical protein n=1 Tax=Enterococcus TaxID=1350 RepID=UPI0018A9FCAC|nr:hypothetical protein [Enterococcus casseliflavus]